VTISLRAVFGSLVGWATALAGGHATADEVRFQRLSDQQTYPVQVFGKQILPGTRRIYLSGRVNAVPALMARPGIVDCLKPGYPVEPSSFDWEGMRDDAELTVCLHHAFASIGSAEGIAAWLTEAGLEMGKDGGDGSGGVRYGRQGMSVYAYSFVWKTEGRGPLYGPHRGNPVAGQSVRSSTIDYALDPNDMPIDVGVSHQGTWVK
jgi:hypothetical protein